jgi:hypothetical protein
MARRRGSSLAVVYGADVRIGDLVPFHKLGRAHRLCCPPVVMVHWSCPGGRADALYGRDAGLGDDHPAQAVHDALHRTSGHRCPRQVPDAVIRRRWLWLRRAIDGTRDQQAQPSR